MFTAAEAKAIKKVILTTQDLLNAIEKHGDDVMYIDIDNIRPFSNLAQYISVYIKTVDDEWVGLRNWKTSSKGVELCSNVADTQHRLYPILRVGLSMVNSKGEETDDMKCMLKLCEIYDKNMKKLRADGIITDEADEPRKQKDGTYRPAYFINTKPATPIKRTKVNRNTKEIEDLDHPRFWISIPKKKFYRSDEEKPESKQYLDHCYLDKDGNPDPKRPLMTYDFAPTFHNIDDWYHHPRTGKKMYKKLGEVADDEETIVLDNTNIHKFLTKESIIVGNLTFEVVVSGRQAKLEFGFCGTNYVRVGEPSDEDMDYDDDRLEEFGGHTAPRVAASTNFLDDDDTVDDE